MTPKEEGRKINKMLQRSHPDADLCRLKHVLSQSSYAVWKHTALISVFLNLNMKIICFQTLLHFAYSEKKTTSKHFQVRAGYFLHAVQYIQDEHSNHKPYFV